MESAYAAIGRAVFAAQLLETALVPIFEFFKMHAEPGYIEKTGGYIPAGAYRLPIKSIVNSLSANGNIAPDLEQRLSAFTEDRHTLIHRWVQERGWPDDNDAKGFQPIMELAHRVEREAEELARCLTGYMNKFADPEWAAANQIEYTERMAKLFHRAHLEG